MATGIQTKERLFPVKEAAERLNVTPGRVRQLIREGRVMALRPARDLLVPESAIRHYQATRRPYRKA
jgi:excisionase family DNA binding protein